jgi:hypothetical protein
MDTQSSQSTVKTVLIVLAVVVLVGVAYSVLMGPDRRTTSEKVGDAIHELPNGVDKAAGELKDDRNPGRKVGDAIREAGDKVKETTSP